MIRGADIGLGTWLLIQGQPHVVVERELLGPLGSRVRFRATALRGGHPVRQTIGAAELVEAAEALTVECQYQYDDGESYMFLDRASLEQIALAVAENEARGPYLREGETYALVLWEGEPVDVRIPPKMVFTVAKAESRTRSDTPAGATKSVTTDTGLVVRVPLFIAQGERIVVDTATNEYVERAWA
ncbi:MAG TPA: elongation factor P [Rectinemataceae bacterium]|nr:elongation factor P [Rectinemataceae bacterium]